eukprot:757017-Hanusia_phi.AAC.4
MSFLGRSGVVLAASVGNNVVGHSLSKGRGGGRRSEEERRGEERKYRDVVISSTGAEHTGI